jgi:hypothetical protein
MGHGARLSTRHSPLVTVFFASGCWFVRAREDESQGNAQHAHLCATCSAPKGRHNDRGRENRLNSVPPPSEPDGRISRIRLSSRWFYLEEE